MIPYIGDFAEDATIHHYFNTFDSNDPSASVTISNLADTDIYVYKDGNVVNLVTDGASVVIDFDSRTGVHKLTIDTSIHADYATGSDYMVLIEGTMIDSGTVTAGIFTFSIENRYNDVNVVTISGTAQTANDNGADINDILVDTADLQANQGDWATVTGHATEAKQDIIDTNVDDIEAAIAALNDLSAGDVTGAVPTAIANADALLNRDMSAVSDTNARSPLNALRFLRNKWSVGGTTLTVTKEDDSTSAWTAVLTADAAADPVTGSDPV